MEVLFLVLGILLGVITGLIGLLVYLALMSVGTLRVDQSDPMEPPYLFLDLDKPIESFINTKHVLFRISKKNFISEGK